MNTEQPLTQEQVLSMQHAEWLGHPVTQRLIKNIEFLREQYVGDMAHHSSDNSIPDQHFRARAYGIKSLDTVLLHIKSTTQFVEKSEKIKNHNKQ